MTAKAKTSSPRILTIIEGREENRRMVDDFGKEAEKRGLLNYRTAAEAIPHYVDEKNIELFKVHKIFTDVELYS